MIRCAWMSPMFLLQVVFAASRVDAAVPLARVDRDEVLRNAADVIEMRYVDAALGKRLARELRKARRGWPATDDPERFAAQVTHWLRQRSGDGHLGLSYSADEIPEEGGEAAFSAAEAERWYGAQLNHGVERIERLPGNVMLLELRVFPPAAMAGDVFAAAMNVVAQGDALIIDLRRNGGGVDAGSIVLGHLLVPGSPLSGEYHRPDDVHRAAVSPAWVPGRRFGPHKPLYVLTSSRTFSAAEAMAYDLQALERAVIVGETTGGGAHPFEYRRVHRHFALDLPESRSVNPLTDGNWQDVGVKPDVDVPASDALDVALGLARTAIGQRAREAPTH